MFFFNFFKNKLINSNIQNSFNEIKVILQKINKKRYTKENNSINERIKNMLI